MVEADLVVASPTWLVAEVSFGANSPIRPVVEGANKHARTIDEQSIILKILEAQEMVETWPKSCPIRGRFIYGIDRTKLNELMS